jgi:hypothetical protein
LGREIGGGEVEVAFKVNPAYFVGELGGEGFIGFVEGELGYGVLGFIARIQGLKPPPLGGSFQHHNSVK